ncbi:MAG TPA: phosphoesterase [Gammaproteobacteria bacterium]|nr:phosphoesterase [Gammaproteobacteria bacterium]
MNLRIFAVLASALCLALAAQAGEPEPEASELPNGQFVTPLAAPGSTFQALNPELKDYPDYNVGQAMSEALSPDGKTLLILTSGFNEFDDASGKKIAADSGEYVFVYDVSASHPKEIQVIPVPNTFAGIAFAADGTHFYVSGGGDDDVHVYAFANGAWAESGAPLTLGHKTGNGIDTPPVAAGLATTADDTRLVVANYYNDSVSLVNLAMDAVTAELDLRPGKSGGKSGTPGGENPFWVTVKGDVVAYVSSQRDREVDAVDITGTSPRVAARIKVQGTPNEMLLDKTQARLYVACDNSDTVTVIDTKKNRVATVIPVLAPPGTLNRSYAYRGAAPNSLALSPDGNRLYVTDGGTNAVAVVALDRAKPAVLGLIPTGWYPQAVVAGSLQSYLYVVNSRSKPGPNPGLASHRTHPEKFYTSDQYVLQLEKAGFLSLPVPADHKLAGLTQQVMANDNFNAPETADDRAVMAALHHRIKHVIYIIKENRTYDQVLGDLPKGNGDASLAEFGRAVTPNLHAAAERFVTLDNFYVSGEVSGDGWPWSTAARESDQGVKTVPMAYSSRGPLDDTYGLNRSIDVAYADPKQRRVADPELPADPDLLPGSGDVAGIDGPGGRVQQGYLWSAALRAHLSVRNYGMELDPSRYAPDSKDPIPKERDAYGHRLKVAFPAFPDLIKITDPYYRGFDPAYPDFYREREWRREFAGFVKHRDLPALSLLWMPGDHMGDFGHALDGVNTPELQQADGDYAVGELLQALAASPYARDTLVFIVEDDAQDGPDHVDAHRSTSYIVGAYVRHAAVVSRYYSTVNLLRTIEDVLGIDHLSVFDANARPMADVFDLKQRDWSYTAAPSALLANTQLPIPGLPKHGADAPKPTHPAAWWAQMTKGMDFSREDRVDAVGFNRIVWQGLMAAPYPTERSGADLRSASPDTVAQR